MSEGRQRINSVKTGKSKALLSKLFIDYHQSFDDNNDFDYGIMIRRNTDKIDMDHIKINNDFFMESWKLNIKDGDDFSEIVSKKLDDMKKESISKLDNLFSKFKSCYNEYEKKISNYINEGENSLSKVMDLKLEKNSNTLLKFTNQNIFNKIANLSYIYNNILINIENNFDLLNKFLIENELYEQKNPIEYFLNKNSELILNCSIISKFNFDKIDISKIISNIYYKYYINFIKEYKKKIMIKTFKIKKGDKSEKFLMENFNHLEKLEIEEVDLEYLTNIFKIIQNNQNKNNNNNNLKELVISNFGNLEYTKNLTFNLNLHKIEKLKFYSGQSLNNKLLEKLLSNKIINLVSLTLEKVNMSNIGLLKLSHILPKYLNSLENLSLAHNSISLFKIDSLEKVENRGKFFEKLIYFNLSDNNIYQFDYSLAMFPQIKLLDLSSNSIFDSNIMDNCIKKKGKIVLFNNNIFITNCPSNNKRYIEYLNRELRNFDSELKYLDLSYTFDKENRNALERFKLSLSINLYLIYLNLSYCDLKTDTVINFLKNNVLFSMEKLNLKYNNIEIDIFKKLNCEEIKLGNLTSINLSENQIAFLEGDKQEIGIFNKYSEDLINFIKNHQKLEKIKLVNSGFFIFWDVFITPGDSDEKAKLKSLYIDLKNYLEKNDRQFVFMAEEFYVENIYKDLFSFKQKL